jgi:Orn/Lys/Arg decarboxylase, major domain
MATLVSQGIPLGAQNPPSLLQYFSLLPLPPLLPNLPISHSGQQQHILTLPTTTTQNCTTESEESDEFSESSPVSPIRKLHNLHFKPRLCHFRHKPHIPTSSNYRYNSPPMNQQQIPFLESLVQAKNAHEYSFHMPGHKFIAGLNPHITDFMGEAVFAADLNEISPGVDYLHAPKGSLLEAQRLAAEAVGADRTFFLINGSTVGNQASMLAAVQSMAASFSPARIRCMCHPFITRRSNSRWRCRLMRCVIY